jgi:hypothetical protein
MANRVRFKGSKAHPLDRFGRRRGWNQKETAAHFGVEYGHFRQLVTGHTGVSFARAALWEKKSRGEVRAVEVLRWHERNKRQPNGERSAA